MSDEISLCPFCGKPFRIYGDDDEWGQWYYTHDSDCILVAEADETHLVWLDKQDLIDALNQRPPTEAA